MRPYILLSTLFAASSALAAPPATLAPPAPLSGDAQFTARAYGQLSKVSGNFFFSPASIRMAMAMATEGARGETASELRTALNLPEQGTASAYAALLGNWRALTASGEKDPHARKVALRVANRLWIDKEFHLLPPFAALEKAKYGAEPALVDYKHNADGARLAINRWVSDATMAKIPNLIPPGMIKSDTRLVLTNALYFKGQWRDQFEVAETKREPFFVDAKTQVPAQLMHMETHAGLVKIEGGQLLELPYGNGDIVMDIVLPTKKDGLAALEQSLAGEKGLQRWLANISPGSSLVNVTLPRWKTRSAFSLVEALAALGVKRAFGDADFSGIDGKKDLFIGAVVHEAVVEVDENGTEAAAATAIMMEAGAAPMREPEKPIEFRADHPFLYFIRDASSNVILFAGRMAKPE